MSEVLFNIGWAVIAFIGLALLGRIANSLEQIAKNTGDTAFYVSRIVDTLRDIKTSR